ncbi:transglutaminase [Phyllobacterium salinisoli]|uniref:Transglutaminase n=1 Tax=Phyllobacterium salinisoli TaxID=1899321 RepID=A0A368K6V7_9HYPH|nr:transglutaminase-like cysteine peptidase [Phyllobacterium salinisoli]RCS25079.1 transglutaminase [Phyllobacterium salinisoli]
MFRGIWSCGAFGAAIIFGALLSASSGAFAASDDFMRIGGLSSQPIGHYEFCKRLPQECSVRSKDTSPLSLTQEIWQRIVAVNASVNERIKPLTDKEIYGKEEYWAYPVLFGDCEDYVLEKRRELAQTGIRISDLLITVVRKRDGEGHAVLTVRTDRGDFVLDNLTDEVKNWQETNYTYLKRQAANYSGRWVSIEAPSNLLVGSVK